MSEAQDRQFPTSNAQMKALQGQLVEARLGTYRGRKDSENKGEHVYPLKAIKNFKPKKSKQAKSV